jgi:hypothetical protein
VVSRQVSSEVRWLPMATSYLPAHSGDASVPVLATDGVSTLDSMKGCEDCGGGSSGGEGEHPFAGC